MKIAYVSLGDPLDVREWSGIPYWTVRKLRDAGHDVTVIGPLNRTMRYVYTFQKLSSRLRGNDIQLDRLSLMTKSFARQIRRRIGKRDFDVILSSSSIPIADLAGSIPILFWTGAVIDMMINFYEDRAWKLTPHYLEIARMQEQRALTRCSYAIYASDWAANSVLEGYSVDRQKVVVRPYGPNLDVPGDDVARERLVEEISQGICRFLFVGTDWQRKRGDLARDVVEALRAHGIDAHLTIVGRSLFAEREPPPFVEQKGFVDKGSDDGCRRLMELYASSHFFIMPSSAEALGVVFVEAAGFGLPSIATRVGGIPTVVHDKNTGLLLDPSAGPHEYVERVKELIESPQAYRKYRENTLAEFHRNWSWPSVVRDIENLAESARRQSFTLAAGDHSYGRGAW